MPSAPPISGVYSSITAGGLSDNTVKTMYDFAIGQVLRETPQYRTWVSKSPERPNGPGQTVQLQKYDWFNAAAVTAAKTPLGEEVDADSTKLPATLTVNLTVNEYGFVVTRTKKLKYFSFADVDTYAALAVANHLADWQDEMVQDTLVTGANKLYSGGKVSEVTLTGTDVLKATDVRKQVTKLRSAKAVTWDGQFYVAGAHPHVIHDLREETGSGSWRVPSEYGTDQSAIWRGEFGLLEGARFVQNTRTRRTLTGAASAPVYRTFFMGQEALMESAVEEPNTVVGPAVDKLQRFRSLGWYAVIGWGVYRDEALGQQLSGSSVAAL